jgi:hypothetical protein
VVLGGPGWSWVVIGSSELWGSRKGVIIGLASPTTSSSGKM